MHPSVWSSAIASCAIGLCLLLLVHHPRPISAQLLFASPSNIQQQYQPLINVAFPQNETVPANVEATAAATAKNVDTRKFHGWTPVPASRNVPVSGYTAIQPPPANSVPVSGTTKFSLPVAASLSQPVSVTNPNSTYLFSESVARSSYQKPQSTYMIQPAKYRQAFPAARSNSTKKSKKSKNSKLVNSEVMPIPMIKPHRHGATLGFNLPDQGLTLYLDINELATKPMAQNIGLKVVSHNKDGEEEEDVSAEGANSIESLNEVKPQGLTDLKRKRVTKVVKRIRDSHKNATVSTAAKSGVLKSSKLQTTTALNQTRTTTERPTAAATTTTPAPVFGAKKIKYSIKGKQSSGGNKINIPSPVQAMQANKAKSQVIEIPSLNHEVSINPNKIFDDINKASAAPANRTDIPPTASRIPATYVSQVDYKSGDEELEQKNIVQQKKSGESGEDEENETEATKETVSSGEALSGAISGGQRDDEIEREKRPVMAEENEDDESDNETDSNTETEKASSGTATGSAAPVAEEEAEEEEMEAEDEASASATTTMAPSGEEIGDNPTTMDPVTSTGQPVEEALKVTTTTIPLRDNELETSTASAVNATTAKRQEVADNRLVSQMQTLIEKSAKLLDLSSQQCSAAADRCKRNTCEPNFKSLTADSATTVREIAQQLDANLILNEIGNSFENDLQDAMDFTTAGYTIILPSNSAVRRLPPNLLRRWKQNGDGLSLDVYMLEGAHTLESLVARKMIETRGRVKLHFGNPHNESYTINGQRVVQANQRAPAGGIVHIIDGLLYPHSDKDIIETLKSCGRLDGFVTLAEGTGFASTLKRDGPFTVFVPSNDALQKVPDNDLELIRRNMTALREFLKYHVAQGIYYSQDLIDGQFLPSLLDGEYLQAGVRVDGCTRRLVEVNVSPLYRADIPASNGVIHVVDWILKPEDRDWCNGVILPRRR